MSTLKHQLAQLRTQLDATPWLKWASVLILALLAMFVWQGLEALRLKAQEGAIDEEVKLRQVRGLQGQDIWIERAQQAEALRQALEAEIPTVSTPGMAQATLQSWLRNFRAGVQDDQGPRVTVDTPVVLEHPADIVRVHATLSAAMSPRQVVAVLRQMESANQLLVIETADIRSDTNQGVTLGLNAYYRLQAEPVEAAAPPADAAATEPGASQ